MEFGITILKPLNPQKMCVCFHCLEGLETWGNISLPKQNKQGRERESPVGRSPRHIFLPKIQHQPGDGAVGISWKISWSNHCAPQFEPTSDREASTFLGQWYGLNSCHLCAVCLESDFQSLRKCLLKYWITCLKSTHFSLQTSGRTTGNQSLVIIDSPCPTILCSNTLTHVKPYPFRWISWPNPNATCTLSRLFL